jgi:hypothetical protein
MGISDEELVRQLESVPLVDAPDMREAVLKSVGTAFSRSDGRLKPARTLRPARLYLGLAWAAAVAIVIGITLQRASAPRPQDAAATAMASVPAEEWPVVARVSSRTEGATLTIRRNGDRFAVHSNIQGRIDWDRAKLSMIEVLPSRIVILQRQSEAAGPVEIRLVVAEKEILKASVSVD